MIDATGPGNGLDDIRQRLLDCLQPVPVRFAAAADALYVRSDGAGRQVQAALVELQSAYDAAIASINACQAAARQALQNTAGAGPVPPPTNAPQAQGTPLSPHPEVVRTQLALDSAAAATIRDVAAIRDRTTRKLQLKTTAVQWRHGRGAVAIAILFILVALASFYLPVTWGGVLWLINLALLIGVVSVVGLLVCGVWWGVLVDVRNMLSLSRLQLVTWTVLILSAFVTVALTNIAWIVFQRPNPLVDPLAIAVPQELWALMGISAASFAGSTLIKSNKSSSLKVGDVDKSGLQTLDAQRPAPGTTVQQGQLVGNDSIVDASAADMFRGEEVGNADNVDLGKVQMFAFTFILVIAYGFALLSMFQAGVGGITQFPDLSPSMITLLGISHAGYLTVKAASHTGAAPSSDASSGA